MSERRSILKHRLFAALVVASVSTLFASVCPAQPFPEWRVAGSFGLEGHWKGAQDVLFGRVNNVVQIGTQQITNAPWPVPPSVREIYWCQADFQALAAVKGSLPRPGRKVLWAVIRPDCRYNLESAAEGETDRSPVTRVWFFREEGEYLRPVTDGSLYSISFNWQWNGIPKEGIQRLFVSLLFDPEIRGSDPNLYEGEIVEAAQVARTILPKEEVVSRLRTLATNADDRTRQSLCGYLAAKFKQECK